MYVSALFLLLLSAGVAQGQQRSPLDVSDSSASAIMRMVRQRGPYAAGAEWLLDYLRQQRRRIAPARLDALADSLAMASMRTGVLGPGDLDPASSFRALVNAGRMVGPDGVPYLGAGERLIRIHREGSGAIRVSALNELLSVAGDHSAALAYLREVAQVKEWTAQHAVDALIGKANESSDRGTPPQLRVQARDVLRELYEGGLVTDERAQFAITAYGSWQPGWKPPPGGGPAG